MPRGPRVALLGLLLFAPLAARAHLPHEPVIALAGAPDFATTGKAYLIFSVDGSVDGLGWWPYATLDHGMHWDPIARPSTNAQLAGLAVVDGRPLVATDDGHLWWRDGAVWEELLAPTPYITSISSDNGRLALAGAAGVFWTTDPRGAWSQATAEPSNIVAFDQVGAQTLAVRTRDGRVLFGPPGALEELPDAPFDALDVAQLDGVVYIGGPDGVAVHRAGFWARCGALPISDPTLDYAGRVTRLLATRATLHAGTGQYLYDSTDGCATWREVDAYAETAAYNQGGGSATSAAQSFVGLIASEEYTITAGFRGAVVRKSPLEWHSTRVMDGAFVRGMAFAQPGDGDGRMWWTSYGGAMLEVTEGGLQFRRIAQGTFIESQFGRDVAVLPTGTFIYSGDLYAYASADQGATLTEADVVTDHIIGLASAAGRLWTLGARTANYTLTVSDDGFSWDPVEFGEGYPREVADAVLDGQPGVVLRRAEPAGLLYSSDGGVTWTELAAWDGDARGVVFWPPGEGSRIVRATGTEVAWSEDAGATWTAATAQPGLMPENLRQTDEGVIVGFDDAGRLWRSGDGGDTWEAARSPVAGPQDLLPSRDLLIAASIRGIFWSDDLGENWHQAPFQEHLSPIHEALVCLDADGTAVACLDPVAAGNRLRFATRGDHFRLVTDELLAFTLSIDGVEVGTWAAGDAVALPGGAWSVVELDITAGVATIQYVEIDLDGEPFSKPGSADTGDTAGTGDTAVVDSDPSGGGDDRGDGGPGGGSGFRTTECGCTGAGVSPGILGLTAIAALHRRRGVAGG